MGWLSHLAAAFEAASDARNEYSSAVRLHNRYSGIVKTMKDFHRFWTKEGGGRYYATDKEARIVQRVESTDFSWVCTQLSDSLVGLMYAALVQANNGNKQGFVEKSQEAVNKLDELIKLHTARCAAYQLMRQRWIQFHKTEVKRLK